jgi:NAD(P)-dependent dehydrogenase (short-subunit alcohol dehydrogenase family)
LAAWIFWSTRRLCFRLRRTGPSQTRCGHDARDQRHGNYLLADEAAKLFKEQDLDASMVLTSSANAVVSKRGSEVYDVSKAALSHLVRELAIGLAPKVRVNGISPATVVKGSTMFPRDRVRASLAKYGIAFEESMTDDELRTLLAVLCEADADASADRSGRLRRGDSLSGGRQIALHIRSFDSSGRRLA